MELRTDDIWKWIDHNAIIEVEVQNHRFVIEIYVNLSRNRFRKYNKMRKF